MNLQVDDNIAFESAAPRDGMAVHRDEERKELQMMRVVRRGQAVSSLLAVLSLLLNLVLSLAAWVFILRVLGATLWGPGSSIMYAVLQVMLYAGPPTLLSVRAARTTYINMRWREIEWDGSRCIECEYDLTGNTSGRCPECGWEMPERTEDEA